MHPREKQSIAQALSDDDLIQMIRNGERVLLEELYNRYSAKVYFKCLGIVKNEMLAQDLAHDVMIKIFTSLEKFQGRSDLSFWIHAITYNHCLSYLRKRNRRPFSEPLDAELNVISEEEEALDHKLLKEIQLEQLEQALEGLKPEERLVLHMHYQDGLSIKQMSQILGVGLSGVKMRLLRSRNKLAEKCKELRHD